ncbi:STAS domain-containing protein [Streptomyces sp. NPDC097619]|uniref:STAS domain-containing protein n=1 Tax=Streptomyces sp. NPDC097619 TaxID=3157228 RepID=UPI0033183F4B
MNRLTPRSARTRVRTTRYCRAVVESRPDRPGTVWVSFSGEFDMDSRPVLQAVSEDVGGAHVVADVSGVAFADSSFLHFLLDIRHRLVLADEVPRQLARLFLLTCTTTLFTYAPDPTHPDGRAGPSEGAR